jgi:hypothetical protein
VKLEKLAATPSTRVPQRQAELKERLKGWALIAGLLLLGLASVGYMLWLFVAYLAPAVSSGGDTVQRLGLVGAYNYYTEALRKSVNGLEPVDLLFWQVTITSLLVLLTVGSDVHSHGKETRGQLERLTKQLNEMKGDLERLQRSVDKLDR